MSKFSSITLSIVLLLTSCVDISTEAQDTATPSAPLFVTSTLPPTKQALTVPTQIPATSTPEPSTETTPGASLSTSCRDSAILVEDVTYPDDAIVNAGESFTKTWKLQNVGTCKWIGYTVAFVNGDRMSSPDSVPVPETERSKPVDVSVELVTPTQDGTYRGNFELRNADNQPVQIGAESIFWVQVVVGPIESSTNLGNGNCTYITNDGYVQQLIELINKARADVGRTALTVNDKLMKVAQDHSLDMACNDFLRHSGSDGSWTGDRLASVGYPNSYYLEVIAIGLAQDAMNQWKSDPTHWDAVINSRVTEIGVGYAYNKFSSYGGYWTVDIGGP
ncbi:MAG TPA: NBR1-Ig-like domain-containing protein [Anaerolineales bacterium]|nr:NBR1-Ig-like domain-containing protein [Anaerolineales bacterium]